MYLDTTCSSFAVKRNNVTIDSYKFLRAYQVLNCNYLLLRIVGEGWHFKLHYFIHSLFLSRVSSTLWARWTHVASYKITKRRLFQPSSCILNLSAPAHINTHSLRARCNLNPACSWCSYSLRVISFGFSHRSSFVHSFLFARARSRL